VVCQAKRPQERNASVIRGGDSGGELKKLYSGNLLTQSAWDRNSWKPPFFGMAMMTDKILTIRPWSGLIDLIKLWRHPCRIVKVRDPLLVPITEGLHKSDPDAG